MRKPLASAHHSAPALLRAALLSLSDWAVRRQPELSGDLRKLMPSRCSKRRVAQPAAAAAGKPTATLAFTA